MSLSTESTMALSAPLDGRKQFEGVLHGLDNNSVRIEVPRLGVVELPLDRIAKRPGGPFVLGAVFGRIVGG